MKRVLQAAVLTFVAVSMASAESIVEDENGNVNCDAYASTARLIMMGRQVGESYSSALSWYNNDPMAAQLVDQAYLEPIGDTVNEMSRIADEFSERQRNFCKNYFG